MMEWNGGYAPVSVESSHCLIEEEKGSLCALLLWTGGSWEENIIILKLEICFEEIMFVFLNRKQFPRKFIQSHNMGIIWKLCP